MALNKYEEKMQTVWNCFGDILYDNLKYNLKNTKRCEVCGKRFTMKVGDYSSLYCNECKKEKDKEKNKKCNKKRGSVVK